MNELVAGGLTSPPAATLLLSLAAAFLSLLTERMEPSARKTGIRILPVTLLAILVVLYDKPAALAAVLLLGALGDALLVQGHVRAFIGGLGAFLAQRVGFTVLFFLADHPLIAQEQPWRIVILAVVVLAVLLVIPRAWPYTGPLRWPFLLYSAVLVLFATTASLLHSPYVIVGVILMIYSDLTLACERFLRPAKSRAPVKTRMMAWLARYVGQAVIALIAVGVI